MANNMKMNINTCKLGIRAEDEDGRVLVKCKGKYR